MPLDITPIKKGLDITPIKKGLDITPIKKGLDITPISANSKDTNPGNQPSSMFGEWGKTPPNTTSLMPEAKYYWQQAHIPSEMARTGLKKITNAIPDPKFKSVTANFITGIPKALAETGAEFSAQMISPEMLAMDVGLGAAAPLAKDTLSFAKRIESFKKVIDLGKKIGDTNLVSFSNLEDVLGEGASLSDRAQAKTLREAYSGMKNKMIVNGRAISDTIKGLVPDKLTREALFWFKAAKGNTLTLTKALEDSKYADYHQAIAKAIDLKSNPSAEAETALGLVNKYYSDAGQLGEATGSLRSIRDNYMARIYSPETEAPVKAEIGGPGIKMGTSHAKRRIYDTEFDAVDNGKKFATTDIADTLSIYNEEMARVNSSRAMASYMQNKGLGKWMNPRDNPEGWEQVGTMERHIPLKDKEGSPIIGPDGNQVTLTQGFYAPSGLSKGLKAIADPNYLKKIDGVRSTMKYQGVVKTVDLSFSFFHHFSMAAQTLYEGDMKTFLQVIHTPQALKAPEFMNLEMDFAAHTGITTSMDYNKDLLRDITKKNPGVFSKITNVPGIKQVLDTADKSGNFLFDKYQRYLKVMNYGKKISEWVADNPDATNAEVRTAKIGIAKQVNAVYGGLNWEAMGITKSGLSILRLALLAPDWTLSNAYLLGYALKPNMTSTETILARKHITTALIGGVAVTEGMNKLLTGHYTDKNPKGHELEVQLSPNVYVSLFRGGIGDITKIASMTKESGAEGVGRFAQGKLSPFMRTGVGLISGTKYSGIPITKRKNSALRKTGDYAKFVAQSALPVPFGASNLLDYAHDPQKNIIGALAIGTGIGRYSKGPKKVKR
jgi:hypothetical protein